MCNIMFLPFAGGFHKVRGVLDLLNFVPIVGALIGVLSITIETFTPT